MIRVLGLANAGERELQTDRSEELRARRQAIEPRLSGWMNLPCNRGLLPILFRAFERSSGADLYISSMRQSPVKILGTQRRIRTRFSCCCSQLSVSGSTSSIARETCGTTFGAGSSGS